ncbi:MAG TPA: hypothetical protein VFZ40_16490 [Pyrinomonadaceae bacterium]
MKPTSFYQNSIRFVAIVFVMLLSAGGALGQTTSFTYQGKLTDGGTPANGTYQMQFSLHSAVSGDANQIGSTTTIDSVSVTNGTFTVELNFTAPNAFDGGARWLKMAVRKPSDQSFVSLNPRQPISSTPYAVRTLSAASAEMATNASQLGGVAASQYVQTSDTRLSDARPASTVNFDTASLSGTVPPARLPSLAGDVTGPPNATVLSSVGGQTASNVASATTTTKAATSANTANTIIKRDAGGNFSAGTITASLNGNSTSATTAGNVTGIVAVANGGTGSAIKNFVDLSTNQTVGGNKTFTGTLSGSGSGLTNVPGAIKWQTVSQLAQQAQPNNGYITTNEAQTTITLPAAPSVGDIVRVSGSGRGGWKIAQNAGQSIIGTNIVSIGATWTPRGSIRNWRSVASSADGSKLVAVVHEGQIYTSTDSGVTWTPREADRQWRSVASSADGSKLVAAVQFGRIYTSTDSGVTWTPRETDRQWQSVASSADGSKLVAVADGGQIYTSTDSGVSWMPRESIRSWGPVASSADGSRLVAGDRGGQIYTSIDSGVSWVPQDINREWSSVASSADGSQVVAVVFSGQIYTSSTPTDPSITWERRETNRPWLSVASSGDGAKLVAVANGRQIYISTDSGLNWMPRESNRKWSAVASSADGSKIVAVVQNGLIYTSSAVTTIGTAGYLTGGQLSAIELQYIGNGQFLPLSHSGTIQGF